MEITVECRGPGRRALLEIVAQVFARELKLGRSRKTFRIKVVPGLRKTYGAAGICGFNGAGEIELAVDSRLTGERLCTTVAHEMVHAKQFAFGQLKIRRGAYYWCGRKTKATTYDCPWEIEAYSKERVMSNQLVEIINGIKV